MSVRPAVSPLQLEPGIRGPEPSLSLCSSATTQQSAQVLAGGGGEAWLWGPLMNEFGTKHAVSLKQQVP